ncbi:putative acetyltransferase domain protein [Gregarina niphandrodes]|uniref:Acetyltransferase domain protein n=1 Tax=Gregarina niphandrodes TaxID=110365 RepID=A0A023B5X0_GRENI|nr:putative acetyltransferase domain protein [Gregarina niphandrodes]EZG61405.1 putative acetyltransferase domain protein [Gregarina niphandrodes]|eukprot:XP_011130765.1 putative acetyltransferase domain protein [Gregarina niphandrodes]
MSGIDLPPALASFSLPIGCQLARAEASGARGGSQGIGSPGAGYTGVALHRGCHLSGAHSRGTEAESSEVSPVPAKPPFSEGALTIRELRKEDVKAVKQLCFNHFRSTGLAATRYYVVAHIQDMALLTFLAFVFMSVPRFIMSVTLFNVYLFVKSRWELEQYIRLDCDDLRTAFDTYMENGPQSRFWVAELQVGEAFLGTSLSAESGAKPTRVIAGCVGLVASKETANVGKLVRLIVDSQHRRMKIGSRLLMQVEQYASDIGFTNMRIYTNSLNPTHVKFVRQHGYTIAQTVRRGLMRGDLMTWHKSLNSSSKTSLRKRDASEFDLTIRSAASHVMD